ADLPCGSARAVPLRRGPMALHIIGIGLGDVLLQTGRSTPVALLGTVSRAAVLLALPLNGREAMALNGRTLQPRCVATLGAGAKYEAASRRDCGWATVVLSAATAGTLLGRRRLPPALRPGAHALLRASPAAWARAEALARDACEVAAQDPGVFEVEQARRALRSAVLETADELLASPAADEEPVRTRQARAVHRRLVRLVDDHVTAAPACTAGVAELSEALGVSERRMREAFAVVLGVSPARYLRLRRLVLVRAALRSPGRRWPSVREAALAHGFCHLGRFSCIYRDAFGEPPSTTLGSVPDGRARRPPSDPSGATADGNGTARPALSVRVRPEDQDLPMSQPRPVANERAMMDRSDRCGDWPAAARPLDLPGLAYECESLVVRDPLLPPALVRDLLDVAIALREEADRRQRG
ncbi:MAG TPA: helix-turn-helix domain-containing protein, partial [Acetobacteraceae bacterium]|nr:helix-turn-helix domain-containing protein [Acetobacteraceae bacterium]